MNTVFLSAMLTLSDLLQAQFLSTFNQQFVALNTLGIRMFTAHPLE